MTTPTFTDVYELLKENLMTRDDAVIGEAAGLAMGLVMIGTASPVAIDDMINVRDCMVVDKETLKTIYNSQTILS